MKNVIPAIAISAILFTACNNNDKTKQIQGNTIDSSAVSRNTNRGETAGNVPIRGILTGYLEMKNALVKNDGPGAADAGKTIMTAIDKMDKSTLSTVQQKVYEDVADDIRENAEHCSKNGNNIEHQREHFEMLSKDTYDLVKAFGAGRALYYDYCPMANDKNGATWISETKEINNPYGGKSMPTCGTIKQELK